MPRCGVKAVQAPALRQKQRSRDFRVQPLALPTPFGPLVRADGCSRFAFIVVACQRRPSDANMAMGRSRLISDARPGPAA